MLSTMKPYNALQACIVIVVGRAARFWINWESRFVFNKSNRDHDSPTILNRQLNKISCHLLEVLTKYWFLQSI